MLKLLNVDPIGRLFLLAAINFFETFFLNLFLNSWKNVLKWINFDWMEAMEGTDFLLLSVNSFSLILD